MYLILSFLCVSNMTKIFSHTFLSFVRIDFTLWLHLYITFQSIIASFLYLSHVMYLQTVVSCILKQTKTKCVSKIHSLTDTKGIHFFYLLCIYGDKNYLFLECVNVKVAVSKVDGRAELENLNPLILSCLGTMKTNMSTEHLMR